MKEPNITSDPGIKATSLLRRYMDLPKLLDLLYSRSLYFRRADGFVDRLEGALFPSLRELLDEEHTKGTIQYNADVFYKKAREENYVNCWTIGAKDNMALWHLYGGSKSSVAITSTLEKLVDCAFYWKRSMHFHKVKYVEHKRVRNYIIGAPREVLQYKNDAYKYEKELRIVMPKISSDKQSLGIRLQLKSLDSLIRSVVVSPDADDHFVKAVTDLCKQYGLKAPVRRSKLSFIPI